MTDGELAGYILEKFQNPAVREVRGRGGEIVTEVQRLPTLQGICFELGMTGGEFEARCAGSKELQRAVELCSQAEYDMVVRGGLDGSYNGGFASLLMKNKQSWSEKSETKVVRDYVLSDGDRRMLERAGVMEIERGVAQNNTATEMVTVGAG